MLPIVYAVSDIDNDNDILNKDVDVLNISPSPGINVELGPCGFFSWALPI